MCGRLGVSAKEDAIGGELTLDFDPAHENGLCGRHGLRGRYKITRAREE
jgi:hypothetical protein